MGYQPLLELRAGSTPLRSPKCHEEEVDRSYLRLPSTVAVHLDLRRPSRRQFYPILSPQATREQRPRTLGSSASSGQTQEHLPRICQSWRTISRPCAGLRWQQGHKLVADSHEPRACEARRLSSLANLAISQYRKPPTAAGS